MIRRCEGKNTVGYKNYGGRGISVCQKWRNSFQEFLADVGDRPSMKHTLERRDTNGNYEPSNVVWATMKQQNNNRRNNRILVLGDRKQTMSQWADEIGVTVYALYARLARGIMTVEKALTFQPPLIEFNGRILSATDWSKEVPIRANTIAKRIGQGWTPEEALTTSINPDPWKRRRTAVA